MLYGWIFERLMSAASVMRSQICCVRGVPPPCDGGGEAWVARLGEDLDVPDQHIHMRQDADTILDGVEGFGLVGGGAGEYDGGGECEEG